MANMSAMASWKVTMNPQFVFVMPEVTSGCAKNPGKMMNPWKPCSSSKCWMTFVMTNAGDEPKRNGGETGHSVNVGAVVEACDSALHRMQRFSKA